MFCKCELRCDGQAELDTCIAILVIWFLLPPKPIISALPLFSVTSPGIHHCPPHPAPPRHPQPTYWFPCHWFHCFRLLSVCTFCFMANGGLCCFPYLLIQPVLPSVGSRNTELSLLPSNILRVFLFRLLLSCTPHPPKLKLRDPPYLTFA